MYYYIEQYNLVLYFIVLSNNVLYTQDNEVLWNSGNHCTIGCSIVFYYTVHNVYYYTMQNSIKLYIIIQYSSILYFTTYKGIVFYCTDSTVEYYIVQFNKQPWYRVQ